MSVKRELWAVERRYRKQLIIEGAYQRKSEANAKAVSVRMWYEGNVEVVPYVPKE